MKIGHSAEGIVPGWQDEMRQAFSLQCKICGIEPRALPLGWYEAGLWPVGSHSKPAVLGAFPGSDLLTLRPVFSALIASLRLNSGIEVLTPSPSTHD